MRHAARRHRHSGLRGTGRRPFSPSLTAGSASVACLGSSVRVSSRAEVHVTDMATAVRHPLDPDVTRSTKAIVVLVLGIVATVTGGLVGGVIPGTVALIIARSARADMVAARGYLSGVRMMRAGVFLAWVGIVLAIAA